MKKTAVVIAMFVLVSTGFILWKRNVRKKDEARPLYATQTVAVGDLSLAILATGTVQPENRLEIKPPIAGRIEEILAREGQRVKKGAILAWMSSTERAAMLDAARAKGEDEVKKWEDLYRPTPILSPIDGTLILRQVEAGQTFTSADAVFVMSDRLTVKAQVDETDIAAIAVGQRATIALDAYPDLSTPARVDQVAFDATTVNNVTTYEVTVLPDRVPPQMKSGMTASVNFVTQTRSGVLTLPAKAIDGQGENAAVLVADAQGRPTRRAVTTGLSDGKRVEILSGLSAGDAVLVPQSQALDATPGTGTNPFAPRMPRRR